MRFTTGRLDLICPMGVALTFLACSLALAQDPAAKAHIERANARNSLKHATDRDAARISRKPKATTIGAMLKVPRPALLDDPKVKPTAKRLSAFEKTVWVIEAKIVSVVKREDGDYYFVLEDGNGQQAVAEIPDPDECKGSPFYKQIKAVHAFAVSAFHPSGQPKTLNVAARITGIGFFGGTKSGAKNGARLDPALKIELVNKTPGKAKV